MAAGHVVGLVGDVGRGHGSGGQSGSSHRHGSVCGGYSGVEAGLSGLSSSAPESPATDRYWTLWPADRRFVQTAQRQPLVVQYLSEPKLQGRLGDRFLPFFADPHALIGAVNA